MKYLLVLNDPPYGSEIDARGIDENGLVAGVARSTMDGLTTWTQWADKVVVS